MKKLKRMIQVVLCVGGLVLMTALSQAQTVTPVPEGDIYPGSIPGAWQMTITEMPTGTTTTAGSLDDWLYNWNKNITGYSTSSRYCNTCMGEDLDWLFTPPAEGMYYGYMATGNTAYVAEFVNWTNAMLARVWMEPDGFPGWPEGPAAMPGITTTSNVDGAAGTLTDALNTYYADSFLGDAAAFRVIALMGWQMVNNPGLSGIANVAGETTYGATYGATGAYYLSLAETIYNKWMTRGGWRPCDAAEGWGPGECTVVVPEGMDPATGFTTWITNPAGSPNGPGLNSYTSANYYGTTDWGGWLNVGINNGFSHPTNKSNEVARWMLAMYDVTGQQQYLTHAQLWFEQMKFRTTVAGDLWNGPDPWGYVIWNYWQPNGIWDVCGNAAQTAVDNPTGSTGGLKNGAGFIHPNNGYYQLDSLAMAEAWEHGVGFSYADMQNLINISLNDWWGADPSAGYLTNTSNSMLVGMAVSYVTSNGKNNGTITAVNACTPNPMTLAPTSAGSGAFTGTITSLSSTTLGVKLSSGTTVSAKMNSSTNIQELREWNAIAPYSPSSQAYRIAEESTTSALTGGWDETWDVAYWLMLQSELIQPTGSVQVTVLPADAVTAGAQWMLDGGPDWQSSGTTLTGISAGSHTINFSAVDGWSTPAAAPVTIVASTTTPASGTYTSSPNSYALMVQATPTSDLTVSSGAGDGGITPYTVSSVASGTSLDLVAPATDPTGVYVFSYWTLNGTPQAPGVMEITPTMPAMDLTAVAVYELSTYTLTVQSTPPTGLNIGSGTGNNGITTYVNLVEYTTSVDLVAPATDPTGGYSFSCWTLNGTPQTAGATEITTTMPASALTAVAQYTANTYALTVQSTPPTALSIGSNTGDGGATNYTVPAVAYGTSVDLQAPTPDPAGYTFCYWTWNGTAQAFGAREITPTMPATATTAVAVYTTNSYALTVQSTPLAGMSIGSSAGDAGTTPYMVSNVEYGASVDLVAPAAPAGYTFSCWTLNGAPQTAGAMEITTTMPAMDTTAVAVYTTNTYTLTVKSTPLTGVSIGSSAGDAGTTPYPVSSVAYGTGVDLVAPAADPTGYTFSCWTLNGIAQAAGVKEITPTMPAMDMTAVAQYTLNTYPLTVQSTPAGVNIGSSGADGGTTPYTVSSVGYNTSVSLQAPGMDPTGYTFSQWTVNSVAQTPGQKCITFPMPAMAVTAVAAYTLNSYTLTVQSTPPAGIVITSSTGAADGGTTPYAAPGILYGTTVNLQAPATDPLGYTFSQWTLTQTVGQNPVAFATSGNGKSITFTMSAAITAVAVYTLNTYTLTVQSTPPTGIVITSSTGNNGTTSYTDTVAYGTSVTLTAPATNPAGYNFDHWTQNGVAAVLGTGPKTITFTMHGTMTATAVYTPIP